MRQKLSSYFIPVKLEGMPSTCVTHLIESSNSHRFQTINVKYQRTVPVPAPSLPPSPLPPPPLPPSPPPFYVPTIHDKNQQSKRIFCYTKAGLFYLTFNVSVVFMFKPSMLTKTKPGRHSQYYNNHNNL